MDAQLAKGIKPAIAVGNKGFVPDEVSARLRPTGAVLPAPCGLDENGYLLALMRPLARACARDRHILFDHKHDILQRDTFMHTFSKQRPSSFL